MKEECLICELNNKKQFIEETDEWFVDKSWDFTFPGLYFIRCKRHIESLGEMNELESSEIGLLIQKYSKKSQNEAKAQRVLALSLGLSDPHIHFWILPKTEDNSDDVLKLRTAMGEILARYKK